MDNIFTVTHRRHSLSYFNMTVSLFNRSKTPFEYRFTPFILFLELNQVHLRVVKAGYNSRVI